METSQYELNTGEYVILKRQNVCHGSGDSYKDGLILTNQRIIIEKFGIFGKFKEIICFPLENVSQSIASDSSSGGKQLEICYNGKMERFRFAWSNDREPRIWALAISDRFEDNNEYYDFSYYQQFYDENLEAVGFEEEKPIEPNDSESSALDTKFISDIAKSVIKSRDFSIDGIMKGVDKATKKQSRNQVMKEIKSEFLDDSDFLGLKDEITEIGNEFRVAFGLKPKKTQSEIKEELLNQAFERQVANARQEIKNRLINKQQLSATVASAKTDTVTQQISAIKQLKELLDAGILSPEEFEIKKKEILNL